MKFYVKIVCILFLMVALKGNAQNTLDVLGLTNSDPAAVAYSLRKLSNNYNGAAIQVRRSNDNAIQDIGFDGNGDLDMVALSNFVGATNGFVTIWYDQSGNDRHLVKADENLQPQIVFNGAFKYIGTKVAIDFSGNKGLVYSGSLNLATVITVIKSESTVWPNFHCILDGSPRIGGILTSGGLNFWGDVYPLAIWKNGVSKTTSESLEPVDQAMVLSISPRTTNVNQIFVGNYDAGANGGSILETEAVAFSTLLSDNTKLSVECNQGDYYSILTSCNTLITTQPSSTDQNECLGISAAPLSVVASGINLNYQWYSNSTPSTIGGEMIIGANSSSFIPPVTSIGATYYYVQVSGTYGAPVLSTLSGAVSVASAPSVSISPLSATINSGDSITLTASGSSSYFWGFNNATPLDNVSNYKLAVGLRQLRSSYSGSAIRLRRANDNLEADFGFSGTDLNTVAINTWLNGSDGYCVKLYDQSGNGNDMITSSNAEQPLFVSNGLNNKPILKFTPSQSIKNYFNFPSTFTVIYTAKQTGPSRGRILNAIYNNWLLGWWAGNKSQAYFDGWISQPGGINADNNPYVYTGTGTGIESAVYENGILKTINPNGGFNGPNGLRINEYESSDADVAEIFAFDSALSTTERIAVEKSSASYYGIYGDAPLGNSASITVTPTETTNYSVTGYSSNGGCFVSNNIQVTVLQNPNLSNFNPQTKTYYDKLYTIAPPNTVSSGNFTYTSSNTSVATISGSVVNIVGAGTTTITANQEANATHFSSSISTTLTVNSVAVLTKNGQVSVTDFSYINKNGALSTSNSLTKYGQNIATKSNDGLTAGSAGLSALQIKTDYPNATNGIYWIKNDNINGGTPFQIYADMTTDGGGWTLILCNNNSSGWDGNNAILRNQTSPTLNGQYSIIAYADYLKKSPSGFQYMIEATERGRWGGIWTANQAYSFVNTNNTQTDITLNTMFDSWAYQGSGVEQIMPWYAAGSCGAITTSSDPNGDWWGTLVSVCGWSPVPWMASWNQQPGIIWYWVR